MTTRSAAIYTGIIPSGSGGLRWWSSDRALIVDLFGPFCLRDEVGFDLTPKARKAQGLLALLATAPRLKRSRTWLQDKLWSDRGPEQGAASLRQCLTDIRATLGPHADFLRTEAGWVALDPDLTVVREEPVASLPGCNAEFLEGLDVRDPEFEDWLRGQRAARQRDGLVASAAPKAPVQAIENVQPVRPLLLVDPIEGSREHLRLFAAMIGDGISAQIALMGNVQIVEALPEGLGRSPLGVRVAVRVAEMGRLLYLQVRLIDLGSGTVFWIGLKEIDRPLPRAQFDGPIQLLSSEAASVAIDELGRMAEHAGDADRIALLGYQALRHTVILDLEEQRRADRLLDAAFAAHRSGVFLAQRALIRVVQVYERMAPDERVAMDEAVAFIREALALHPYNPMVTAAAARVAIMLEAKVQVGLELAQKAVAQWPSSPLGWDSMATGLVLTGKPAEAHEAALRARRLASSLPQTYFWDALCCITATVLGQLDDAVRFGEIARDLAPTFKPPLRYLAALYYHQGRELEAHSQLVRLKSLEKDLSLEQWMEGSYPVASLRQTPLIAIARSGLI